MQVWCGQVETRMRPGPVAAVGIVGVIGLGMGVGSGGCATAVATPVLATAGVSVAQAGYAAFVRGELEVAMRVPLAAAFAATHAALDNLQFTVQRASLDTARGELRAREASGRRLSIVLERKTPVVTKINIRVGTFGDQAMSRLILAYIHNQLAPQWGLAPLPDSALTEPSVPVP